MMTQVVVLPAQQRQAGQALVTLLVFVTVALLITTAAITVSLTTAQSTSSWAQGQVATQLAESGAENATLQLLRNPSYTGETMSLTDGTVTSLLSGTATAKNISVESQVGKNRRKFLISTSWNTTNLSMITWIEVP